MKRAFTNILSANVDNTARFYQELLGMSRHFESDWFVILTHTGCPDLEFGILSRENAIVPADIRMPPAGVMLTFVVEDVEVIFTKAKALEATIIEPPTNTPYGQRRILLQDPDGTVVDVSSLMAEN